MHGEILVDVSTIEKMKKFAKIMARNTISIGWGRFFLKGELGAGKTTFVRFFVEEMPGGLDAEVSSPSFNLFNVYPTKPETIHIDLYRCMDLEEEVLEYLSTDQDIVFVEWCNKLPEVYWPSDYVFLDFKFKGNLRVIETKVKGTRLSFFWGGTRKNH